MSTKPRTTGPRPVPTFDHLKKKKARELRDWIVLDDDAADEFDAARRELKSAQITKDAGRLVRAEQVMADMEPRMRANAIQVIFRAVGKSKWRELKADHKPTQEQIDEVKKKHPGAVLEFNPDTFGPAAIAACCVQPTMTVEQAAELDDDPNWSENDFARLVELAVQVNTQRRQVDFTF